MQWELHFLSVLFHPDSPHTLQIQAHDIPFPEILRLFPEQPHNPAAAQIPVRRPHKLFLPEPLRCILWQTKMGRFFLHCFPTAP